MLETFLLSTALCTYLAGVFGRLGHEQLSFQRLATAVDVVNIMATVIGASVHVTQKLSTLTGQRIK